MLREGLRHHGESPFKFAFERVTLKTTIKLLASREIQAQQFLTRTIHRRKFVGPRVKESCSLWKVLFYIVTVFARIMLQDL